MSERTPTRSEIQTAGVAWSLTRVASSAAPPVLALHGFTGGGADWRPLAERVSGDWHAPDLPGHAGTAAAPERFAFEATVAALGELRGGLGLERPVLCGYSFGGRLALACALAQPEAYAGVVLIGATAGIRDARARALRLADDGVRADVLRRLGVAPFLRAWARRPLLRSQADAPRDVRALMAEVRATHTQDGLAASLRGSGTGSMPSLWGELATLHLPVLLLVGEHDAKFRAIAGALAGALPDARVEAIPAAGHAPHLERPEATARALGPFLRRFA